MVEKTLFILPLHSSKVSNCNSKEIWWLLLLVVCVLEKSLSAYPVALADVRGDPLESLGGHHSAHVVQDQVLEELWVRPAQMEGLQSTHRGSHPEIHNLNEQK